MFYLYQAAMFVGGLWCHQLPVRSPHLSGMQMPLCWRCSGILIGTVGLLAWLIATRKLPRLTTSLVLSLPLALDVLYAILSGGEGDNSRRFITGILWGIFGTSAALGMLAGLRERLGQKGQKPARQQGRHRKDEGGTMKDERIVLAERSGG
ncbi:MAG: DUF2085 domain-containing protein [Pyrinomonadaceae bacterium]|nr:DUF2085 domain-containing protein [Pyrinomonadaceae bacterium]MDQ3133233.1 DUF2085 domain-containing protein [Acidobacteriota bacterium]